MTYLGPHNLTVVLNSGEEPKATRADELTTITEHYVLLLISNTIPSNGN